MLQDAPVSSQSLFLLSNGFFEWTLSGLREEFIHREHFLERYMQGSAATLVSGLDEGGRVDA